MNLYQDYINEIEERKALGLHPKPIDDADLLNEIIAQIKDTSNENREDSVKFFIYNTLPGTTSAAGVKAQFLKEIILGQGNDVEIAKQAAEVLKTQVFLYDADTARLADAFNAGNQIAKNILESYAKAEFFTKLPEVAEEIKVVTYIAAEGDISTDLLSPGN